MTAGDSCEQSEVLTMPDHSYIETPQQQRERRERQSARATAENDPMALARLQYVIADAIDRPGMDAPWHEAAPIVAVFPSAHFEHKVNEHGVSMRRLVVAGEWEMDVSRTAPYTGEKWDQPVCCERHDDAGEAETCCEYCPNRLPLRVVETSPGEAVDWHRHTHDMWVGEGYGAKVLVEVDGLAKSRRVKWCARTFDGKTISDIPRTLADAKRDGIKYLWSRRPD